MYIICSWSNVFAIILIILHDFKKNWLTLFSFYLMLKGISRQQQLSKLPYKCQIKSFHADGSYRSSLNDIIQPHHLIINFHFYVISFILFLCHLIFLKIYLFIYLFWKKKFSNFDFFLFFSLCIESFSSSNFYLFFLFRCCELLFIFNYSRFVAC